MNPSGILSGECAWWQRCFGIEHAGVSRVAHAEVQFLCQKWTVHGWCDIKHVEGYTVASNTSKCKAVEVMSELSIRIGVQVVRCSSIVCEYLTIFCGDSLNELCFGKEEEFFSGCMSDSIHDVAHLVSLPINFVLEDAPIAKTIEFLDDVVYLNGDLDKNSAMLEQKDLLGAVSFLVADDVVPNSEVLKAVETQTVDGEVVVDFPAMDVDGKNEASFRKVVIEEVLVPIVGAPTTGGVFDRFLQSSGMTRLVSSPLRWSTAESWPGVASHLDLVPLAMDTPGYRAPQFEQLMMAVLY